MPRILAIETSQNVCAVALRGEHGVCSREENAARQHARLLLPMIKEILSETTLDMDQLDAIAFACGPGSFTGVRISVSVAQGLAFGANCPMLALSSLEILARSAARHIGSHAERRTIMVNQDARMGEVYSAAYRVDGEHVHEVMADSLLSPVSAVDSVLDNDGQSEENNWLFTGDAIPLLATEAESRGCSDLALRLASPKHTYTDVHANAECVLEMAEQAWHRGAAVPAEQAAPTYLRGSDAWKKMNG